MMKLDHRSNDDEMLIVIHFIMTHVILGCSTHARCCDDPRDRVLQHTRRCDDPRDRVLQHTRCCDNPRDRVLQHIRFVMTHEIACCSIHAA